MAAPQAFGLERFVDAQAGGLHEQALAELRAGSKRSHWMWFVFPQLRGFGHSATARHFGIDGLDEARAYLGHAVLGPRLLECAAALEVLPPGIPAAQVFGGVDTLKLRSSLTLFATAAGPGSVFERLLARFFDGVPDAITEAMLREA